MDLLQFERNHENDLVLDVPKGRAGKARVAYVGIRSLKSTAPPPDEVFERYEPLDRHEPFDS